MALCGEGEVSAEGEAPVLGRKNNGSNCRERKLSNRRESILDQEEEEGGAAFW